MGIIYSATNIINGKKYVGKTIRTLRSRMDSHIHYAKHSSNYIFHRAIRKYGAHNFMWKIIFECEDEDELLEHEKRLAIELNAMSPSGYNMKAGNKGAIYDEEYRLRLSNSLKGHSFSQEGKDKIRERKSRPVICTTSGKIYPSGKVAEIELGLRKGDIWRACNGVCGDIGGLKFSYVDGGVSVKNSKYKRKKLSPEHIEKIARKNRGKKRIPFSEEWRRNISLAHMGKSSPVIRLNDYSVFRSIACAADESGIGYGAVYEMCKGRKRERKTTLKFMYLSDFRETFAEDDKEINP